MRPLVLFALALAVATGSAFAENVWVKPGSTQQEFQQTRYACLREAASYPIVIAGMSQPNYGLAVACMNAHGFQLVPAGQASSR
jgi:hypothetical protein